VRFGYHVGVKGRPASAIENAVESGSETIQFFPSSPQQWGTPKVSDVEVEEFDHARKEAGVDPVFFHSIYLVNMAAPDDAVYKRSVGSLVSALDKAEALGIRGVVTHVGNHKGRGEEFGLERISKAVLDALKRSGGSAMLLLETTAGAGTAIGNDFEQFGAVFELTGRPERLGFCLDTCHVVAAGYDLSTAAGIDSTLEELDRFVGLDRLVLLHMNDSKGEPDSHLDRHAHIGQGVIGLEAFRYMVNHPALEGLPAIVELPHEGADAPDDIGLLRSLADAT